MTALLDALTAAFTSDSRVRALFVTGSTARGQSDAASDLDVLVICDPEHFDSLVEDVRDRELDGVPTTLLHSELTLPDQRVYTRVAEGWVRYDINIEPTTRLTQHDTSSTVAVYDPDGLASQLAAPRMSPPVPAPRVEALVIEFLRSLGLFAVGCHRRDWVTLVSGGTHLRMLTLALFGLELPPGGLLRLKANLSESDYAAFASLPALEATEESCRAFHQGLADLFLPAARALATRSGAHWPDALEAACRTHLAAWGIAVPETSTPDAS